MGKTDKNKNVIILAGENTSSAADRFVADMKEYSFVTVLGNNTGGEELMGSYNCMALPNSKLVFIYMPGGTFNSDGTDNSAYGTAPDKYVSCSIESLYRKFESYTYSYSERKECDEVLKYSLELFEN